MCFANVQESYAKKHKDNQIFCNLCSQKSKTDLKRADALKVLKKQAMAMKLMSDEKFDELSVSIEVIILPSRHKKWTIG